MSIGEQTDECGPWLTHSRKVAYKARGPVYGDFNDRAITLAWFQADGTMNPLSGQGPLAYWEQVRHSLKYLGTL